MFRFPSIALCALMLSACSKTLVSAPMPPPPANLASPCPYLAGPIPLLDPDRAQWEGDVLASYRECAGKHRATIGAWNDSLKESASR